MLTASTFCPNCNEFFVVSSTHDEFRLGRAQECPRCHSQFNIFQVYRTIFEEIPIGKTVADKAVEIIYSPYKIHGDNKSGVQKIEQFMADNFSEEKLKKIIYDCVVYGTCILRKTVNGSLTLENVYLPDYEIIEEFRKKPGYQSFGYHINELRNIRTGDTIPDEQIISLFTESDHRGDVVGFSRYGMWFNKWHVLKIGSEAIINASLMHSYAEGKTLKEFFDQTKRDMLTTVYPMTIGEGSHERSNLSSCIAAQLFPTILDRQWSLDEPFPTIIFDKDQKVGF